MRKNLFLLISILMVASMVLGACAPATEAQFIDPAGVQMALVPAAAFMMGSESGYDDESPVHEVYLDNFYIDVYEVTNSRYMECVAAGGCDPPANNKSYTHSNYYGNPDYADYPVIYVSWYDAEGYCEWRGDGARLPSEAEWEKAARGGLKGMKYPWGDENPVCRAGAENGAKFDDDAGCNLTDTEVVGSYSPNGYGLYDMAGNVWEWVADWYDEDYYDNSPYENPAGPTSGDYRVLRGGSWDYDEDDLRTAIRGGFYPDYTNNKFGFRCARSH